MSARNADFPAREDARMGDVAIQYRVLPDSPDANIENITEKIRAALPEGVKIHKVETKPFAFGLSAIELLVVMKDTGGLSEKTEEALSGVEGIQGVELLEMSLI
jgi:elongation factor 1-beta